MLPTSVILAAAPLLKAGLVQPEGVIADSKSGVSGAGRGLSLTTHFCEINDGIMAYKVVGHRHTPEIEQELGLMAGTPVTVCFTPHLTPFSRGILSTVYLTLKADIEPESVHQTLVDFYKDEKFVRVRKPGDLPHTLDVRGTNFCDLGAFVDSRTRRVKVVSVIDNLTRGAAGQAVCNMNIMFGLPDETGLSNLGLRPLIKRQYCSGLEKPRNIKLVLEYDGTGLAGWQRQAGRPRSRVTGGGPVQIDRIVRDSYRRRAHRRRSSRLRHGRQLSNRIASHAGRNNTRRQFHASFADLHS